MRQRPVPGILRTCGRVALAACVAMATLRAGRALDVAPAEIDLLVAQLGADEYAARETAALRLAESGAAAADALLTAAETSDDLEVALRARWLVQSLPRSSAVLSLPDDPPAVAEQLGGFARADAAGRMRGMQRLLRLDDDAGIEPLARIVRLDRTSAGSRTAAALLIGEWQPDDPYWPELRGRVTAGIGASGRPAARFLRALVDFSGADSVASRQPHVAAAATALATLERFDSTGGLNEPADHAAVDDGDEGGDPQPAAALVRIFRRCLVQMLVVADRRDEALAAAAALLEFPEGEPMAGNRIAAELSWLVDHGLPEAVDLLEKRWPRFVIDESIPAYAAALAFRRRADGRAATLADSAFAMPRGTTREFLVRRLTARLLVAWGAADWATREYAVILDDPQAPAGDFAQTGIWFSELLHDQGDDARAAAMLREVVEGRGGRIHEAGDQILPRIDQDPQGVRSRMLYFQARAALTSGAAAEGRRLLEEAIRTNPRDVDALIAFHRLADHTPEQRAESRALVQAALAQIDEEIQGTPDQTNSYNEYAWLVANTEGDVAKATRYSLLSLEKAADAPSYLDTLAHCRAAAGDFRGAVRTQLLAVRLEPHNRTIRNNLERFRSQAARTPGP